MYPRFMMLPEWIVNLHIHDIVHQCTSLNDLYIYNFNIEAEYMSLHEMEVVACHSFQ